MGSVTVKVGMRRGDAESVLKSSLEEVNRTRWHGKDIKGAQMGLNGKSVTRSWMLFFSLENTQDTGTFSHM